MALPAAFTDLFGIAHPVALAPMGGCAGGRGVIRRGAGVPGDADWLDRKLAIAAEGTARPRAAGFLSWAIATVVQRALVGARGQGQV
jgi:nitronate monooxygenase